MSSPVSSPVSLAQAMWRGFTMKCPHCGEGHLFGRFLKVADHCEVCGEDYTPQRADDFPAYLVILVLGHLLVPIVVAVNIAWDVPLVPQMIGWSLVAIVIAVLMIRPAKGAVIGAQWALRMGGFGKA